MSRRVDACSTSRPHEGVRPARRGSILVYVLLLMPVLIGLTAFSIDWGRLQLASFELSRAADTAARYGTTGISQGRAVALLRATTAAAENKVDGRSPTLADADFELGFWSDVTRSLTPMEATDPRVNAIRLTLRSRIPMTFASFAGRSDQEVTARVVVRRRANGRVLFVTQGSTPNAEDAAVRNHLVARGFTVDLVTGTAVTASSTDGKVLVVISESIESSSVNTKLRNVAVPVIVYEPYLVDDMGMTGTTLGTHFGYTSDSQHTRLRIESTHSLAAGLGIGLTTVSGSPARQCWGKPNSNAIRIATNETDSTKWAIYAYDKNVPMPGLIAPERRVAMYYMDTTSNNINGWLLFDAAVNWCVGAHATGGQIVSVR